MDPEIESMEKISKALQLLEDEAARARVLKWAVERFGLPAGANLPRNIKEAPQFLTASTVVADRGDYHDFIDSVEAKTGLDRILTVSYWFQAIQGADSFDSYKINTELKNLGFPSANITRDMQALISRRQVLQVRKEGTTKQARKRYRLTRKGLERVEALRKN